MYAVAGAWAQALVARVGDVCIAIVQVLGAVIGKV